MKNRFSNILTFFFIALICGCASTPSTSSIDELLFDLKRSVIISQERSLFEEYVKYNTFNQHYFSLYTLSGLTLNTSVSVQKSSEIDSSFKISKPPEAGISGKLKTITTHGGKITLSLNPLPPIKYYEVKKRFEYFKRKIKIDLFYVDLNGNAFDEKGKPHQSYESECHLSLYCVPLDGWFDTKGRKAWAYPVNSKDNIGKFKEMEETFYIGLPNSGEKSPGNQAGPVFFQ